MNNYVEIIFHFLRYKNSSRSILNHDQVGMKWTTFEIKKAHEAIKFVITWVRNKLHLF